MCGIAGIAGETEPTAATRAVSRMIGALARRGPDGDGMEVWNGMALGHRRLAIFDLSAAGRQPMLSPDSSVGIVFNGAIYNFRELRIELERARLSVPKPNRYRSARSRLPRMGNRGTRFKDQWHVCFRTLG